MLHFVVSATLLLVSGASGADVSLVGRYTLPAEGKTYGGLSAIHISDDGSHMIAVSDRGTITQGDIVRDQSGQIVDVIVDAPVKITPFPHETRASLLDSEGIAVAPDGTFYISFEGFTRVGKFTEVGAPEEVVPITPEFSGMQSNAALEALAIDSEGRLYALPERTGRYDRPFPVYRFDGTRWSQPFAIPRTESFLVVGADFGPDGLLYLLERDFSGIGFLTRVRRVDFDAATSETILQTGLGVHGNMEGISVWQNAAGETIMTLIADDNFRGFLNNEIAEYRVDG